MGVHTFFSRAHCCCLSSPTTSVLIPHCTQDRARETCRHTDIHTRVPTHISCAMQHGESQDRSQKLVSVSSSGGDGQKWALFSPQKESSALFDNKSKCSEDDEAVRAASCCTCQKAPLLTPRITLRRDVCCFFLLRLFCRRVQGCFPCRMPACS